VNKNRIILLLATLNVALLVTSGLREFGVMRRGDLIQSASAAPASVAPAGAAARRTEFVTAAERVSPSIVSVGASRTGYMVSPFADFFSNFAVFPYEEKVPYLGSGVIVDPSGLIVTNFHVVENTSEVFVTLLDGREFPPKVQGADAVTDVAMLKIEGKNLPSVKLGDSDDLMVGEWVLAMGNPFGNLIGDPHPTVTAGVVSALRRSFRPSGGLQRVYQDMIQTDAAINPGNSGGALINCAGELVGINTFIMSRSGGAEGIGFAIPVSKVKAVIEEILIHKRVRTRLMDFHVQNMNERIARMVGARSTEGAVVSEIAPGGPAQKAGLHIGDVIVSVDGRKVRKADDFTLYVYSQQVGATVKCDVDRKGQRMEIDYELTEAKAE
jgi:serine protease Do